MAPPIECVERKHAMKENKGCGHGYCDTRTTNGIEWATRKQWFINWQSQENLSKKIKDLGIYLIKYNFKAKKVL